MIEAIDRLGEEGAPGRVLLSKVLPVAEQLAEALREHPACEQVTIAGSARRWTETCKDIDLIATATDPAALAKALAENPLAAQSGSAGPAGTRIVTFDGIAVDLRIVEPEAYGNLLQHFTGLGRAQHRRCASAPCAMGLSVSEHGITDVESGDVAKYETEAEVYERLGLAYVEPELREGNGEIAAAAKGELPKLVELERSPGRPALPHDALGRAQLAHRDGRGGARARLRVPGRSPTTRPATGSATTSPPRPCASAIEEVAAYNASSKGRFALLAGSEVNILPDGSLDYEPEVLERLDWVVASVHTSFRTSRDKMTERVIAAIENPLVDCIGHLTGRLIGRREPYDIDVEAVAAAAAEHRTFIEINGNPNRRDLSEGNARLAAEAGVRIVVNTDAHGTDTLSNIKYGIATARRAWLTKAQIANTRTWKQLLKLRGRHASSSLRLISDGNYFHRLAGRGDRRPACGSRSCARRGACARTRSRPRARAF